MIDSKLYTLLKVAELGSFTQAGKALNLTQPAISQHIHALEGELGAKLFERSGCCSPSRGNRPWPSPRPSSPCTTI